MFYHESKEVAMTTERISKYINLFKANELPRLNKLNDYYNAKNQTIMLRKFTDIQAPNYKICNSWGSYLTSVLSQFFVGKGITINSQNEEMLTELNAIYKYTDETSVNNNLAVDSSIYGYAVEMLYLDSDSHIRFTNMDVKNVILIFSNNIEHELLYGIYFYNTFDILTDKQTLYVELYSDTEINYFKEVEGVLIPTNTVNHYFGQVPINVYQNKDNCGDWERIISLIDEADRLASDSANERESFANSYMVFKNTNLDDTSILSMKSTRNICIEDSEQGMQSSVSFLSKNSNPVEVEANKTRIDNAIEKFTFVSELQNAKSHTSATSSSIGLIGIKQLMSIKSSQFKKSLTRRIELICNILNTLGANYDFREITVTFVDNVEQDLGVLSDSISKLRGLVSDETLLEQLPFITDVEQEKARLEAQNSLNSYANMFGGVVDEQSTVLEE